MSSVSEIDTNNEERKVLEGKISQLEEQLQNLRDSQYPPQPEQPVRNVAQFALPRIQTQKKFNILLAFFPPIMLWLFFLVANYFEDPIYIHSGLKLAPWASVLLSASVFWILLCAVIYAIKKRSEISKIRKSDGYKLACSQVKAQQVWWQSYYDGEYEAALRYYNLYVLPEYNKGLFNWKSNRRFMMKNVEDQITLAKAQLESLSKQPEQEEKLIICSYGMKCSF